MRQPEYPLEYSAPTATVLKSDRNILEAFPRSAGPRIETQRGGAFYSIRPAGSQLFRPSHHFIGIMLAPIEGVSATLGSDRVHNFVAPTGHMVINPAHVDSTLSWPRTRENAVIAIRPESLQELAAHELNLGDFALEPPPFGTVDHLALAVAQRLKAELTRPDGPNELYVDSLITIFAVHVLRSYTTTGAGAVLPKGGLSREAARRVKEYISENLGSAPSIAELAGVAGLSPAHFIQAFTKRFGLAPHRYVLDMRLDLADRLLQDGRMPIADVAYASGFSSQSHLTTAMKKYRGRTPGKTRLANTRI